MSMTTQGVLSSTPLICGKGSLAVWHQCNGGVIAREDIELLGELVKIWLKHWPTLAQLREHHKCPNPECQWFGGDDFRIPVRDKGRVGCPRCGWETVPALSAAEQREEGAGTPVSELAPREER